jgi:hypothetical protein
MNQEEEKLMDSILKRIYSKINITEEIFEKSMNEYVQEYPAEIHQVIKLTQNSMQELKDYYYDVEKPALP